MILYINPMAKRILHISDDITDTHYRDSLSSLPGIVNVIDEMIEKNRTCRRAEVSITKSNFNINIGYSSMQVKDPLNNHIGYTIIFQDLSIIYENKQNN